MLLGGVMLYAGMMLEICHGDYLPGDDVTDDDDLVRFLLHQIVEVFDDWDGEWVLVVGTEKLPGGPWRQRRIRVRTRALRRSSATLTA